MATAEPQHLGAGYFSTPHAVHAGMLVVGAEALGRLKHQLEYRYRDTDRTGRIDIMVTNPEALAPVRGDGLV